MKILVMWSGGIDSTFVLARLLKESKHEVHAHRICLINCENRHHAETLSINKLYPKLHAIRPFDFTTSTINHSKVPQIPYDMAVICFEAGVIAKGLHDRKELGDIDVWTIGTNKEEGHWQERWDIIEPAFKASAWSPNRTVFPKFELQELVTKKEEMQYLNNLGILSDCWYCRTPIYLKDEIYSCGRCKTCNEVKETYATN